MKISRLTRRKYEYIIRTYNFNWNVLLCVIYQFNLKQYKTRYSVFTTLHFILRCYLPFLVPCGSLPYPQQLPIGASSPHAQ